MAITLDGTNGITTPDVIATSQSSNFVTTGNISAADLTLTGAASATDLTLSGGVYLGGTGSANYLDDYEEGTIPSSSYTIGGTAISGLTATGRYIKVGNKVTVWFSVQDVSVTINSTGPLEITLPFAQSGQSSTWRQDVSTFTSYIDAGTWNSDVTYPTDGKVVGSTASKIRFYIGGDLNQYYAVTATGTGYFWLFGSYTYVTA